MTSATVALFNWSLNDDCGKMSDLEQSEAVLARVLCLALFWFFLACELPASEFKGTPATHILFSVVFILDTGLSRINVTKRFTLVFNFLGGICFVQFVQSQSSTAPGINVTTRQNSPFHQRYLPEVLEWFSVSTVVYVYEFNVLGPYILASASQWYFFISVANFTLHDLIKCILCFILSSFMENFKKN